MKRLRILNLRVLLALAALCGAAYVILFVVAASTRAQRAACGPANAQTVAADTAARIFRVPTGHSPLGTLHSYYGCTVANAKPQLLASTKEIDRSIVQIKLRGVVVGVDVSWLGTDGGGDRLTVRNLATGQPADSVNTGRWNGYGSSLDTYALAPSGNIAWSISRTIGFGPANEVVIGRAIGHTVRTLDRGPENRIRASSLRLSGGVLSWVDGGEHRHASLP